MGPLGHPSARSLLCPPYLVLGLMGRERHAVQSERRVFSWHRCNVEAKDEAIQFALGRLMVSPSLLSQGEPVQSDINWPAVILDQPADQESLSVRAHVVVEILRVAIVCIEQ